MPPPPSATAQLLDVRGQFPILGREIDGHRIVYLDSAATSQKPERVLRAMDDHLRTSHASIHRGVYRLAEEATAAFEGARERIAAFVGGEPRTTIFTANASAALNLVASAWGRDHLGPGDAVVLTRMEHHSNIVPWQMVAADAGAELRWVDVDDDGRLDLAALEAELARPEAKVLAVTHVSNVLGTITPIAAICAMARAHGVTSVVDGSQAVPQLPVDLATIDADFYAWTGHKALGPTGIGVLHGRRGTLEAMRPFLGGGHMIRVVRDDGFEPTELPWKFEAGTSPIVEAVGLGAAIDVLGDLGMDRVRAHEQELTARALRGIADLGGVRVFGPPGVEDRAGVVAFEVEGMHAHDVGEILGRHGVCVRAGHHCAQPLMRRLGVPATARASFGPYNGPDDVDALLEALADAKRVFGL